MDLTNWISKEPEKEVKIGPKLAKPEEVDEAKSDLDHEEEVTTVKKPKKEAELPWSEKYRPEKLEELVGNETAIASAKKWAEGWDKGEPKKKALIIFGKVGIGKTSLSYVLANEYNWEVLEMNASDKRSQDLVEQIAGFGSQTRSFSGKRKAILVEEIEGLSGVADRGASQALIKVIKGTKTPIILTCNDIKNKKLSGIKVYCEQIPLKKIAPGAMVKRLKEISEAEGIKLGDIKVLQKIADNSEGDMRSAINDLQTVGQGDELVTVDSIFLEQRDRPIDVYKAMQRIFRCNDYKECRRVLWSLDEEPRNFLVWLDENIPVEYKTKSERGKAYAQLSRADVFLGRVTNRQYWGFLRYVNDLMTVGIGYSKDKPVLDFNAYKFPSLIMKMGSTRGKRAKEKSIASKISPVVHESETRIRMDYLPLLKRVFEKNRESGLDLIGKFELEEEEVEYLG